MLTGDGVDGVEREEGQLVVQVVRQARRHELNQEGLVDRARHTGGGSQTRGMAGTREARTQAARDRPHRRRPLGEDNIRFRAR